MNTAFVPVFVAVGGHSAVGVGEAFFGRSLYYVYRLTDLVRQKKPNAADRWPVIILWPRSKTRLSREDKPSPALMWSGLFVC